MNTTCLKHGRVLGLQRNTGDEKRHRGKKHRCEYKIGSMWIVHQDVELVILLLSNMLFWNTDKGGSQYSVVEY